jgi:hypothetical protein
MSNFLEPGKCPPLKTADSQAGEQWAQKSAKETGDFRRVEVASSTPIRSKRKRRLNAQKWATEGMDIPPRQGEDIHPEMNMVCQRTQKLWKL